MKSNQIVNGFLSRFNTAKNFGLIESIEGLSYYFYNDTSQITSWKERKKAHKFGVGDEVEFTPEMDSKGRPIATDVVFMKNPKRDSILEEAKELNILKGYLKKIDDKFFVKHISTYIFIPIVI